MKQNFIMRVIFLSCIFVLGNIPSVSADSSPAQQRFVFHWVNLQPEDGLVVDAVVLFFHDGSFDLYETGSAASPLLTKLATRQFTDIGPLPSGVRMASLLRPHDSSQADAGFWSPVTIGDVLLDPSVHRYATAYIALRPSNDAFLGNDDSYRIRLFDRLGNAEMPVVDFIGSDVMDAGVCVNDEANLQFLDVKEASAQHCQLENGVVRRHPGFNGSVRNPAGTPKRILGGTSVDMGGSIGVRHYDQAHADFSRGGTQIGRLVFMSKDSAFSLSGSYYDPTRSGEGFSIETFRRPGHYIDDAVVYWYTFEPATGRPLWLIGSGKVDEQIVLYSARGGSINSPSNPEAVVRSRWGTLQLNMVDAVSHGTDWCNDVLSLHYKPDGAAIPTGFYRYRLQRLTPRGDAAAALCRQLYP